MGRRAPVPKRINQSSEKTTDEGTDLKGTQENSCRQKLLPVLDETHAKLNETPCEDEESEPVANTELTKNDVPRKLAMRKRVQRYQASRMERTYKMM